MNFVFLSPNFPKSYYNFCKELKNNGVNVLGIGDEAYESLSEELKNSLNEYYKVDTLESYDEVYRAIAYFIHKYGRIDYLESNNEYWIERDSYFRQDFNISGVRPDKIDFIKYKSRMKELYQEANVKTARYLLIDNDLDKTLAFAKEVDYPVIVKPNNGVGASKTYKLNNDDEVREFYYYNDPNGFIMEEFINGELLSFDGICNSKREPVFMTAHAYPIPIMEIVLEQTDSFYYSYREIPADLLEVGLRVVKAFPTEKRFFHTEYFRLLEDKKGLGKKGDIIGLEVNMRPPGGYTPDMMNYANDINVYKIYADVMCYDDSLYNRNRPYHAVYVARRKNKEYQVPYKDIVNKYANNIVMEEIMPEVLSGAMGDIMITARFETLDEVMAFIDEYRR